MSGKAQQARTSQTLIQNAARSTATRHPLSIVQAMAWTPLGRLAEAARTSPVLQARAAATPNRTGLPDGLKANVEAMSGFSMDDVRVHRNSPKPAQLHAHAYAQGTDIHLAPGQEKHLAHEAWHVVQQKQGRVRPTMQLKGVGVNDDAGLEQEADASAHKIVEVRKDPARAKKSTAAVAGAVQRITLENAADLAVGLYNTGTTLDIVGPPIEGGGFPALIFYEAASPTNTRAEAIGELALLAAKLGKKVHDWGVREKLGKPKGKSWSPTQMFNRSFQNRNPSLLDPFVHRIVGSYGEHGLSFTFQHSAALQGYITQIVDSNAPSTLSPASMYHGKKTEEAKKGNRYSNQHDVSNGNQKLIGLIEGIAPGSPEARADAYTKLAGEGARWQCVRLNLPLLKTNTRFYCEDLLDKQFVRAISFKDLWTTWKDKFGKKYDIENHTVIKKLEANKIGSKIPFSTILGDDIKLT